jgi:ABC-2 type transport system permease protein
MMALFRIEWFKLLRQPRTYYALGALILIEWIILFTAWLQGQELIEILLENLEEAFHLEGNLLNGNLLLYVLLNSLWFNLPLILMIVTSGLLTSEYKDRTVQAMLLQAVDKRRFILAKYAVAVSLSLVVVLFMSASSALFSYALFGGGDLVVYLGSLNFFPQEEALFRILLAFGAGALIMIFYAVVSLTLAVFFRESTQTWILSALFLVVANLLLKVELGEGFPSHFFFPKLLDTWQYFFYHEIDWSAIGLNSGILLLYTLLFGWLGVYYFMKSDVP